MSRVWRWLRDVAWRWVRDAIRRNKWGVIVTVATYIVFCSIFLSTPSSQRPGSDGHYTWLFARSIVFDHDIDFKNDYDLCGDPYHKNIDRGTGHADNPFYIGPTIVWAPILWTLKHVYTVKTSSQDVLGACHGPITARTLWSGTAAGALIVFVMYRLARRFTTDGAAALTAGLLGLCTSLPAYAAIAPSYSHIYDALFASLMLIASVRAAERPRSIARWALAGTCVGLCLLQRPVSALFGVIPAILATRSLWRQWRRLLLAYVALGVTAFAFGALPQMLVYHYLYGKYLMTGAPHGRFYMQYAHAHPWLVLFAPHGGLFLTAPISWLAVIGTWMAVWNRKARWTVLASFVACIGITWLSSAALDWHGSGTFGARRLVALIPLMAIPTALVIARVRTFIVRDASRARTLLGATILITGAFTIVGAAGGLARGRVSTEWGMSQADLYGGGYTMGWLAIDESIGDLAILPIEWIYALRYRHAPNTFRDATEPLYMRNYRTLDWETNEIDFKEHHHGTLLAGFKMEDDGAHLVKRQGNLVFAAQWPFATQLFVRGSAMPKTKLRVGRGRAFSVDWFASAELGGDINEVTVPIPEGGFDSGIMEIVFEVDDLGGNFVLKSIKIDDQSKYGATL